MPTYVYHCQQCQHEFEVVRGVRDDSPVLCSQCQSQDVEKKLQPVAIAFHGKGFHVTDYPRRRN